MPNEAARPVRRQMTLCRFRLRKIMESWGEGGKLRKGRDVEEGCEGRRGMGGEGWEVIEETQRRARMEKREKRRRVWEGKDGRRRHGTEVICFSSVSPLKSFIIASSEEANEEKQ